MRALQHIAQRAVQPRNASLPVIPAVDEDPPLGRLEEAAGQVDQCALSGAGLAHNGDRGPGRNVQAEVLQHIFRAVRVVEGDIVKGDVAADRLPVFRLLRKQCAVLFCHFGRILHVRLLLEEAGHALNVGLGGDQLGEVGGHVLDRLEHVHGIGGERRERADHHRVLVHQHAAALEDDRDGHGAEEDHQGDIDAVHAGGADAVDAHLLRHLMELPAVLLLNHQHLGRLGAHDALVVPAGDDGVLAADLAVPLQDPGLEIPGQKNQHRDDQRHADRKPPVEDEHDGKDADHVEQRPEHIGEVPRHQRADPARV